MKIFPDSKQQMAAVRNGTQHGAFTFLHTGFSCKILPECVCIRAVMGPRKDVSLYNNGKFPIFLRRYSGSRAELLASEASRSLSVPVVGAAERCLETGSDCSVILIVPARFCPVLRRPLICCRFRSASRKDDIWCVAKTPPVYR